MRFPPHFSLLAIAAALLLSACLGPGADYRIGLGTTRVTGILNIPLKDLPEGGPVIVVIKYHHTFIETGGNEVLKRPSAHKVYVGAEGEFNISMPTDVVEMIMMFIAPGHLTDTFHLRRQLGVGDVTYRPNMQPMTGWRSHYYTYLKPQLQHYITEERYRMSPGEQNELSKWLQLQDSLLAAP